MIKKFLLISLMLFCLTSCWLKGNDPESQERLRQCKEHVGSDDRIIQSEQGGTYIIENNDKYYRLHPNGMRQEVERRVVRR